MKWRVMVNGDYKTPKWKKDLDDEGSEVCISINKEDGHGYGWYDLKKILIEECFDEEYYNRTIRQAKKFCRKLNK